MWMFFASCKINETRSHLLVISCRASFKVEPTQFVFTFVIVGETKLASLSSYLYYSGFKRFFFYLVKQTLFVEKSFSRKF